MTSQNISISQLRPMVVFRAGHLGFVVLKCSSKSYFQANLTIKNRLSLGKTYNNLPICQIHLTEDARNGNFQCIKI